MKLEFILALFSWVQWRILAHKIPFLPGISSNIQLYRYLCITYIYIRVLKRCKTINLYHAQHTLFKKNAVPARKERHKLYFPTQFLQYVWKFASCMLPGTLLRELQVPAQTCSKHFLQDVLSRPVAAALLHTGHCRNDCSNSNKVGPGVFGALPPRM